MRTSAIGHTLIKAFEVFVAHPYDDQDPVWPRRRITWNGAAWVYPDGSKIRGAPTIGYGFVIHSPADYTRDMTEPEASMKLLVRLPDYEAAINRGWAKSFPGRPDPTQFQGDAMASFAWNEGGGAVQTLIAHLAEGALDDEPRVRALFGAWNKWTVNGKLVENVGLTKRRAKEATLFLRPVEIAWGPGDVEKILASVHDTAMRDIEPFLEGKGSAFDQAKGPAGDDEPVPPTDPNVG